jgi:hypothetical protein
MAAGQHVDVTLHDQLLATELSLEARSVAELFFGGKEPGHHVASQMEINR